MIVRADTTHLILIRQPDHAAAARRILERHPALSGHPRRSSILLAAGEHDSGWTEFDAAPQLSPEGGIEDFVHVPLAVAHAWAPGSIRGLSGDAYAAALVAHHGMTVYERYRGDAAWEPYFRYLTGIREERLAAAGLSAENLRDDYPYLRLGDLVSLAFCTRWPQEWTFGAWRIRCEGDCVTVDPGEVGVAIPFSVRARRIGKGPFSPAGLPAALAAAEPLELSGEVRL